MDGKVSTIYEARNKYNKEPVLIYTPQISWVLDTHLSTNTGFI